MVGTAIASTQDAVARFVAATWRRHELVGRLAGEAG